MDKQSDAYILVKLSSEIKSDRQEAMLYLYKSMYDKVRRYILNNSGTSADVDDVFQDSVLALYKLASNGKLEAQIKIAPYFFTICKNHWLKELQKRKKSTQLTASHENIVDANTQEDILIDNQRKELLDHLIKQFGTTCYEILRYYYYDRRRMKEIASLLLLSNEQAAKDKKASCMKKLRKLIKDNPHFLELLK